MNRPQEGMECGVDKQEQNPGMADDQDVGCSSLEEPPKYECADDINDIDVEAILSRTRCHGRQNIYEAPEFVKRLNSYEEVTAGATVVFACQWTALPDPAVKWYKDDEEITENDRYKFQMVGDNVEQVIIEQCRKADEGAYKCKAENREGVASTTGYLSVTGPDLGEAKPPPHSQSDHCISVPPPRGLRTIVEQKSLEEREEEEYSQLPPSPIQDFIDNATARRGHTWPYAQLGYTPDDFAGEEGVPANDEDSESSDTSTESQDYERVSFEVRQGEVDQPVDEQQDDEQPLLCVIEQEDAQDLSPPIAYTNSHTAPFSSSESEASSSDVSLPEICIETVSRHRRKRPKRLPLERTTAVEIDEYAGNDKKRTPVVDFTVAKVSKVALASFKPVLVTDNNTSVEKALTSQAQTLQGVLGIDLLDVMEQVTDSPWRYYILFACCCAFLGAATEAPVPFYVLSVAMLALVSFRVFFHHEPTLRKF